MPIRIIPIGKLGDIMNLQKIEPAEMKVFLKKHFSKGPIKVSENMLDYVLEISENVPYNVQHLCHHLWNWCLEAKKIEKEDFIRVLDNIIHFNTGPPHINYRFFRKNFVYRISCKIIKFFSKVFLNLFR